MKKQKLTLALTLLVVAAVLTVLCGCVHIQSGKDIVVLFTNDVHCGIEDNIGYAGLAAYKKEVRKHTPNVTLVDCGDSVQGALIGTVSKGEFPARLMNYVGYDFAVLGNHEFDYGMDQIESLIAMSDATYIGCNIEYTGSGDNKLGQVKPYSIVDYGHAKVAYIGVSTPESIVKSTPAYFMEDGEFVYGFYGDDSARFYARVQKYIDETREAGADYVVVASHLGDLDISAPYNSVELIRNTTGIDVLLDGHAHNVIPCRVVNDKDNRSVKMASTGTKLQYIGELVITPDGNISLGIVSDYAEKDEEMTAHIEEIKATYSEEVNKIVASSDVDLYSTDANGIRMVRNRETTIGNLCADAYRSVSGADVAFVNGGGIRANIKKGDISYADIIAVHPFGNSLCMVKATGAEILDALEHSYRFTQKEYTDGTYALGESGGFLHISGLRVEVDTSVANSVITDEKGMFIEVSGERRVKNVQILRNGEYVDIDPEAIYTVACHNYMLKNAGDGYTMFRDNELLIDEGMIDNQILITYITQVLNGNLSEKYSAIEGRIIIK